MKNNIIWTLLLSAWCTAAPLDSAGTIPTCVNGVLNGFDNSSPITTLAVPITLSVNIKGTTWVLASELDEDVHEPRSPRTRAITKFEKTGANEQSKITFANSALSQEKEFQGRKYLYSLNALKSLYDDYHISFWRGNGHFDAKVGYKCIDGVAKMILLPPAGSVYIVHEPAFDGDYVTLSYGPPTGGVLSYGGGRGHYIHDVFVNLQS